MKIETKPGAKKRQRSENWLEEDKILLKDLVRERVGVIENKTTDTITNNKKVAAWADLQNGFNIMCKGAPRTLTQLKSQWGIIKWNTNKHKPCKRREPTKAGSPPPTIEPSNSDDISAWLPSEFIDIDKNESDSDHINQLNETKKSASSKFSATEKVAINELQCRMELHRAQLKNEKLKAENLALEKKLLETKIKYYVNKTV